MTKRRFRFNFRLRSLLICFVCIAFPLALYAHFDHVGREQLAAVKALEKMEMAAYTSDTAIEFHLLKRQDHTDRKTIVPVINLQEPDRMSQIGRRLLGDVVFTKYTSMIVDEPLRGNFDAFHHQLSQLPYLETIYFYDNILDQSSLDEVKRNRPDVMLVHIPGSPLRMPGRSAMQRYVD